MSSDFVSEIASFPNLRLKHTQYEGIATRPIFTLITLNAAPKTDTKNVSTERGCRHPRPGADIAVSNTDGPVNPSQDKGGIGVEQTSPSETSTASTDMLKTTEKTMLVKNQKDKDQRV